MPDISKISILYVEDEPELRDHVTFALRLHIDNVATAANGQEALDLITLNQPDIVVADIRMPLMDGLALTGSLHRNYPAIPVILCTAFTDTEYLLKAIELGDTKADRHRPTPGGHQTGCAPDSSETGDTAAEIGSCQLMRPRNRRHPGHESARRTDCPAG